MRVGRFLMAVLTGLFFGLVPPELIAWLRDAPDPALPMLRQRHPARRRHRSRRTADIGEPAAITTRR